MFLFCFFCLLFILGNCLWLMILSLFKLNELIFHSSQNCMWLTFNFFNRIILIFLIFNFVIFIDSNPHSFLVCFAWDFEYPIHIEGRYSQDFLFFVFFFFWKYGAMFWKEKSSSFWGKDSVCFLDGTMVGQREDFWSTFWEGVGFTFWRILSTFWRNFEG